MAENEEQDQAVAMLDELSDYLGDDGEVIDDGEPQGDPDPVPPPADEPTDEGEPDPGEEPQGQEPDEDPAPAADAPTNVPMVPLPALHEARSEIKALRDELRELRTPERTPEPTPEPEPEPTPAAVDLKDDEIVTGGQVKQAVNQAIQQQRIDAQKERLAAAHVVGLKRYTEEAMGEGLDFETVTEAGKENLSAKDMRAIRNAVDPAREAYKLCVQRTPELGQRMRLSVAGKKKPGPKPPPENPPVDEPAAELETDDLGDGPSKEVFDILMG